MSETHLFWNRASSYSSVGQKGKRENNKKELNHFHFKGKGVEREIKNVPSRKEQGKTTKARREGERDYFPEDTEKRGTQPTGS